MKSKDKKYYYGVAGLNGYGVYTDYDRAMDATNFLYASRLKRCTTFEDAKHWATERLLGLQDPMETFIDIKPITSLNWTVYKNKD